MSYDTSADPSKIILLDILQVGVAGWELRENSWPTGAPGNAIAE